MGTDLTTAERALTRALEDADLLGLPSGLTPVQMKAYRMVKERSNALHGAVDALIESALAEDPKQRQFMDHVARMCAEDAWQLNGQLSEQFSQKDAV